MAIQKKIDAEKLKPALRDYQVLLEPVVTEKASTVGAENASGIIFRVDKRAGKSDIKQAVEKVFGVEVASVRTCNFIGKPKRAGMRQGRRTSYKKAYISLKPGSNLDLYEGI